MLGCFTTCTCPREGKFRILKHYTGMMKFYVDKDGKLGGWKVERID